MNPPDAPAAAEGGLPELAPLREVGFRRLGTSAVGARLARLLLDQGACEVGAAGASPARGKAVDVVIDDRTDRPDAHRDAGPFRAANRRLVFVKFTDFPPSHPRWTGTSCLVDAMIHAELGLDRMEGEALDPEPLPIASAYGAIWAAIYIAVALLQRDRTGSGATIELPLFSMALTVLGRKLQAMGDPRLADPLAKPHLPMMAIYPCGDGRHVQLHGSFPAFAEAACTAFGHDEWRPAAGAAMFGLPDVAARDAWRKRFSDVFLTRPAQHWEQAILAAGGACTLCRTRDEFAGTEHARAARLLVPGDGGGSPGLVPGPAVRLVGLAATDAEAPRECAPEASPEATPRSRLDDAASAPARGVLVGVRVVDFSVILAGPTCGRTLAEQGADVIKVDAPTRPLTNLYGWVDVNRGKRSLLVDMRRPEGREIVRRLIASADVVVDNFRMGKLAQLGFGYEEVARLRPGIVYASLNAFDFGGPWSHWPGWEHSAQAATGMQIARQRAGTPRAVPVPVNDYATGLLGAFGVLAALREARASGRSIRVMGSLARTAVFMQAAQFGAPDAAAADPPAEALRCSDGWVRVLIDPVASGAGERLAALRAGASEASCVATVERFRGQGFHATIVRRPGELRDESWMREGGHLLEWRQRHWGALEQVVAVPAAGDLGPDPRWPASDPGEDAASILAELDYLAPEVDGLLASGVVRGRTPLWPDAR